MIAAVATGLFLFQGGASVEIQDLIEQLGSDRIEIRDRAQRKLGDFGRAALVALEQASRSADPEVAHRALILLREMPQEVDVSLEEKLLAKAPSDWTLEHPADRRQFVWHASVIFSKDGRRAGFAGGQPGQAFNVVNDVRSELFDWVSRPEFGNDGKGLFYSAGKAERRFLFLNGVRHDVFERMWNFVLSPDGKRFAYMSETGKPWDPRWRVVVDGIKGEEFSDVDRWSLKFSPDSKRVAYKAYQNGGAVAVIDGVKSAEFPVVWSIMFSPDGSHVVLGVGGADNAWLVLDGEKLTEVFHSVLDVVYSPDGKRLGYIACHKFQASRVILDGIAQEPFDRASGLIFSPDGARCAYQAELGEGSSSWSITSASRSKGAIFGLPCSARTGSGSRATRGAWMGTR